MCKTLSGMPYTATYFTGGKKLIPNFIALELYGPYGPDMLRKLGKIETYYHIYEHGARFETESSGDYIPARLRSHQIKELIRRESQFLFGKMPGFRVSCPEEAKMDGKRPNEAAMQGYLNTILKKNHMADKLICPGLRHRREGIPKGESFAGKMQHFVYTGRRFCLPDPYGRCGPIGTHHLFLHREGRCG